MVQSVNDNSHVPEPPRAVAWISKQLWRVNQGLGRIAIFWNIIGFLTFIKVWQQTFEYFGIGIGAIFLILGISYFFTSWAVGYFNEVKRFSRAEWEHQIAVQNPEYWQLLSDAAVCRRILEQFDGERNDGR